MKVTESFFCTTHTILTEYRLKPSTTYRVNSENTKDICPIFYLICQTWFLLPNMSLYIRWFVTYWMESLHNHHHSNCNN